MLPENFIGLKSRSDDCPICKAGYQLNRITMDLLLSRKSPEEILFVLHSSFVYARIERNLTLDDLAIHAEHCDSSMVPDDYILFPDKYEDGEKERYKEEKAREENRDEHA